MRWSCLQELHLEKKYLNILISIMLTVSLPLTIFSKFINAETKWDNFLITFNNIDTSINCSLLKIIGSTAICTSSGHEFLSPVENINNVHFSYLGRIYIIHTFNSDTIGLLNLTSNELEKELERNEPDKGILEYRKKEKLIVRNYKKFEMHESCYSLGNHYGRCAMLSLLGRECESNDDIVIPARCRNKSETEKGIKAGMSQVKAD